MKTITWNEYRQAKAIIQAYHTQKFARDVEKSKQVQLSEWGRTMQKPHNKIGIVVDRTRAGTTDFDVKVLWSCGKIEIMHESQVQYLHPERNPQIDHIPTLTEQEQ